MFGTCQIMFQITKCCVWLPLKKLQLIQNAAAKLIFGAKKFDHVTPILHTFHWLPIQLRIIFKVLLLTYKSLNGYGPIYLQDLLTLYQPSRCLRSSSAPLLLDVPKCMLKTYGERRFGVFASVQWNMLPVEIRTSDSVSSFKSRLKTHLFLQHFTHTT